ncbi:hypothetical protein GCM10027176_13300 [Actinoallomurus bryophytorum]|uniref:Uncharacterized protein n=1 Tax=Actinoallomurus bryophytorum TaxID=1490222 RepID=A0A543CQC1_9ACTN|nr:hypothetical protein FB559_4955 [Actinoallomurus bryophytorum]
MSKTYFGRVAAGALVSAGLIGLTATTAGACTGTHTVAMVHRLPRHPFPQAHDHPSCSPAADSASPPHRSHQCMSYNADEVFGTHRIRPSWRRPDRARQR